MTHADNFVSPKPGCPYNLSTMKDISGPGPPNPTSNKLLFYSAPSPLISSANTIQHGLTLIRLRVHNSSTQSNLTFSNTKPQPLEGLARQCHGPARPELVAMWQLTGRSHSNEHWSRQKSDKRCWNWCNCSTLTNACDMKMSLKNYASAVRNVMEAKKCAHTCMTDLANQGYRPATYCGYRWGGYD